MKSALFMKVMMPFLALCTLNSNATPQNFWHYFGAVSNGHQLPMSIPSINPRSTINWDWQKKCATLTKQQFLYELEQFFNVENRGFLDNQDFWLNGQKPSKKFFSETSNFEPYVMKLEVKPGAEIAFHGDVHGDKDSLIAYLTWLAENGYTDRQDPFKIIKDNFYIMFLGDYTDRGKYGAEVIFTIARLKRSNPDRVFLVRGNHEDITVNENFGFKQELKQKFQDDGTLLNTVNRMYNYLPVAIYLVCNNSDGKKDAILCCHGGIEVGFNINTCKALLNSSGTIRCTHLGALLRQTNCVSFEEYYTGKFEDKDYKIKFNNFLRIKLFPDNIDFKPQFPRDIHFLWNDFDVDPGIFGRTRVIPDRGWECDQIFTNFVNKIQSGDQCTIHGIFRGHQHGDNKMMMRILNKDQKNNDADIGVGKLWIEGNNKPNPGALWDGIVCTFCVCPNTGYGQLNDFNFDAFGILKTANKYTDWKLQMHRIIPIIN